MLGALASAVSADDEDVRSWSAQLLLSLSKSGSAAALRERLRESGAADAVGAGLKLVEASDAPPEHGQQMRQLLAWVSES